jgi:opacity protein-like surface antigen
MHHTGFLAIVTLIAFPLACSATELAEQPYFLRLMATLQRASNFSSAASLQATAGHSAGWSVNPATSDIQHETEPPSLLSLTATNMHAVSESGAWFTASATAASIRLPELGTIPIAYARTDTIDGKTADGFDSPLRSNEFFWGYSKEIFDDFAVGIRTRYVTANIQQETAAAPIFVPARFETDLLWYLDYTIGLHYQLDSEWSVGAFAGNGWGRAAVTIRNIVPLPNPGIPSETISPGTRLFDLRDGLRSGVARLGVGYTPNEQLGIYADGEYFRFETDQLGGIDTTRAMLGVEYRPCPHKAFRAGGSLNNFGQFAFSTGIGYSPTENTQLELAYQHNAFPEIQPEFGRLNLVSLSGFVTF